MRPSRAIWLFLLLMIFGYVASFAFPLLAFGVHPRTFLGLLGIPLGPFLHGDILHLTTNAVGLLTFGFLFAALEGRRTGEALAFIVVVQGGLTWLLARPGNHVGASGVVFGLFGYLASYGFFYRRFLFVLISLLVIFLYGTMLMGMLPLVPYISWEAHLSGFIAGVLCAYYQR